ncbi:hypothetical protein A6U86_08845 [Rhizobium sp. AC27/96]|uniref:TetR/AcrR family transcriptional regulator n=1 Tax=Rhizobium sp. AC27/96 TaxID=1841653 RepID=UPI0008284652|nr:TetR/AcrR family transcriptional regulator [Rhizobium sp. AC27/96]OCJ07173.1 hypothetical protein A6U86_08845 [Rhizobium sp. AC27/96]
MPRNREEVRRRLMEAALELYQERGYEQTTAAEIAQKAGVTERTFFRHFPDKREMFFHGETALGEMLTAAVRNAPRELGPWETLFKAFRSAEKLFIENRHISEPGRRIVAASPALQERQAAKVNSLTEALAAELRERGVAARRASLIAKIGMAVLAHAVASWLDGGSQELDDHLIQAFEDVSDLSAFNVTRFAETAEPQLRADS